jgi:hypothetical protein
MLLAASRFLADTPGFGMTRFGIVSVECSPRSESRTDSEKDFLCVLRG